MIIVDPLFDAASRYHGDDKAQAERVGARSGHRWCHMASTVSEDDLHAFATRIGLRRAWHQGDHYDLTPSRRARAVRLGAVEVSAIEMAMVTRYDRRGLERPVYSESV